MATVADVLAQVKWQADRARGGRLVTADLIAHANRAHREAWDAVIAAYEDYRITTSAEFTLTGGASSFSHDIDADFDDDDPSDFYKLKAVQVKIGTRWSDPLPVYSPGFCGLAYRLEANVIYLEPQNGCAGTYRYRYVSKPAALEDATGADVIEEVGNGWIEDFMVDWLTIRVRDREEESSALMSQLKADLTARVSAMAKHRVGPRKVADVRRNPYRRPRTPWTRLPEDT